MRRTASNLCRYSGVQSYIERETLVLSAETVPLLTSLPHTGHRSPVHLWLPPYLPASMANPSQLFLLADHIKLSLLERQRAISLDLEPTAQDGNISRSLESMREGIETLEQEVTQLRGKDDP